MPSTCLRLYFEKKRNTISIRTTKMIMASATNRRANVTYIPTINALAMNSKGAFQLTAEAA